MYLFRLGYIHGFVPLFEIKLLLRDSGTVASSRVGVLAYYRVFARVRGPHNLVIWFANLQAWIFMVIWCRKVGVNMYDMTYLYCN